MHSSGNALFFRLAVGNRAYSRGYDISYTSADDAGCGGTLYDARGVVTSPGFPNNHSSASDCTWTLKVPQGQRIEMKFTSKDNDEAFAGHFFLFFFGWI